METALDLASSARVACAFLETCLERKRYPKALAESRKLWHRIDAMASRIEDLQAEVERLASPPPLRHAVSG